MIIFLFLYINLCITAHFVWQSSQEVDTSGLTRASFPKGFVFRTTTSTYQVEEATKSDGGRPNIWVNFIRQPGMHFFTTNLASLDQSYPCTVMFFTYSGFSDFTGVWSFLFKDCS